MMRWPVIGMLAVAGLAAFWVVATPIPELQEQLRVSQFWVLEALGLALIVTTIAGLAQIRAAISRHDRYLAAGLCAVTFAMVLIAPRTNRIFYDEQIYQGIARNLSDLHLAQLCNDGTVEYRAPAVLASRVQQATVRLPVCPESWLPAGGSL